MERTSRSPRLSEASSYPSSSSGYFPHLHDTLSEKRPVPQSKPTKDAYFVLLAGQVFCGALTYSPLATHMYAAQLSQSNFDLHAVFTPASAIQDLVESEYVLENPSEVERFLADKPELIPVLGELSTYIRQAFPISSIELAHRYDDQYEIDALFVTPVFTSLNIDDAMSATDKILDEFFFDRQDLIKDFLVLSL